MKIATRALFVGRFQPFHRGHLQIVRRFAPRFGEVVVGIGSAQVSHTQDDPFTAGERYEMVHAALAEAGVANHCIVPIPDVNRYSIWVAHVESLCPRFDAVVSRNPLTARLFAKAGYRVIAPPPIKRSEYSATEVRRRMRAGGNWRPLVPKAVGAYLDRIDGVARVRDSARTETLDHDG